MFSEKMKNAVNRFLEGTLDHFNCRLPIEKSRGIDLLLKALFSRIVLKQEQADLVKSLPEDACVIYVNDFKNTFEYLFSYARFCFLGIPVPTIAVEYRLWFLRSLKTLLQAACAAGIRLLQGKPLPDLYRQGYLGQQLLKGEAAFLSLIEESDFDQRFVRQKTDPLTYLIALQNQIDRPICMVPQVFFYSHAPAAAALKPADIFLGSDQRPGKIRMLYKALARPEKMFVELSVPINLKTFLAARVGADSDAARAARILRRTLLSQIARHRQSATGPVVKSFDEIKQSILTNDDLAQYMKTYARRRNVSLSAARRQAVQYFDEIAARYRPGIIGLSVRFVQWLSNTVFDGIDMDAGRLETIKQMSLKGPVIFVPCHRSHIDSMIMLYVMFQNHLSPPHFFAGKNLSFWPVGPLLRMTGAFFVRRSFKGAVFYTKVFSAYIYQLLKEGFHIAVFIEGTRSRSGKLLEPQLGMINILLNAYENKACTNLIFVPVYIGYERVPEERAYLNEIQGRAKPPESAGQVLQARKLLKTKYGKIYVKFNDPIDLNLFISRRSLAAEGLSSKQKNIVCRELGNRIMSDIDRATVVTPRSLVAAALLNSKKNSRSFKSLMAQIHTYLSYLASRKMPVSSSLTGYPRHITAYILNHYAQMKIIDAVMETQGLWQDEDTVIVRRNRRSALEYYKNNAITHFVPAAIAALSILAKDAFLFQTTDILTDYRFLADFFSLEFIYDCKQPHEFYVRKSIKAFIDADMLTPHAALPDTYVLTSPGHRKLKQFALFLSPFLQSYSIVLRWLSQHRTDDIAPADRVKKIMTFGRRLIRNRESGQEEALSGLNLENALRWFTQNGLRSKEDEQAIVTYESRVVYFQTALDR